MSMEIIISTPNLKKITVQLKNMMKIHGAVMSPGVGAKMASDLAYLQKVSVEQYLAEYQQCPEKFPSFTQYLKAIKKKV